MLLGPAWASSLPPPRSVEPGRLLPRHPPPSGSIEGPCSRRGVLKPEQRGESRPALLSGVGCVVRRPEVLFRPGRRTRRPDPGRAGPGRGWAAGPRPDGGRWHAPGSFEAPGLAGPHWPRCVPPAWGGGGSVQRRRGAGGRRGWAQRGQPSVKGIVPAPQSPPAPAPSGPNSGRPAARGLPAAAHLHGSWARASLCRSPSPPPPLLSRAGCGAICPLIMIRLHKPPPAPFSAAY